MAWEEIVKRAGGFGRTRPDAWLISVNSSGVRVIPPRVHGILQWKFVRVFFGTGEDAGWVLLRAADGYGRKLNKAKNSAPYLGFKIDAGLGSRLPLLPAGC